MTTLPLFEKSARTEADSLDLPLQEAQSDALTHSVMVRQSALWSAYGDALGWISELTDEKGLQRRTKSEPLARPIEWRRRVGGRAGMTVTLPLGCYSDDSQLRLATGRAIRTDGFDVESFAKVELPVWLSYSLGAGRSTSAAATNLARRSVQWYANTFKGWTDSGGNGAAMRIQPHVWAARHPDDPTTFLPDVVRNAICTHSHPTGLLGATLHALALAHTFVTRRCPSPDDMVAATGVAAELPSIIGDDIEVGHYWRSLYEHHAGAFEENWARAIQHGREAIAIAAEAKGSNNVDRYSAIVDRLGLRQPARRGDGTLTAVAAISLIWCEVQPDHALKVAANAIGTDTDTIATMAGAMMGAHAGGEPPVDVLDAELFRSEADRLSAIARGEHTDDHRYPDLLHWTAPKARADTLVALDGESLYVRGLGRAEAKSAPILSSQGKFSWQWVNVETGQTLLIKRRIGLASIPQDETGTSTRPPVAQLSSTIGHPNDLDRNEGLAGPVTDKSVQVRSTRQVLSSSKADLSAMIAFLESHNYEDRVLGLALRRVISRCTPSQIQEFVEVLADRLREQPAAK